MIAQRIKPGVLLISKADMKDNLESYTMLNISKEDAVELLFASENIEKTKDGFVIHYTDQDDVSMMYKAIANKHKQSNPNFIDVSKKYDVPEGFINGTSLLLRDPKTHVIKVCRRTTTNSNKCNINRLFITNFVRDKFFKEVVESLRYKETGKYEMDSRDDAMYSLWSNYMNTEYFNVISRLRESK